MSDWQIKHFVIIYSSGDLLLLTTPNLSWHPASILVCEASVYPDRRISVQFVPLAPFESHLGNLLRDEAHHEDKNGCCEQKGTHIRKTTPGKECVKVISQTQTEHQKTDGHKDPQGRIQGADLGDDQEKPYPILENLYLAIALFSLLHANRDIFQAPTTSQNPKCERGGIGIGVGKEVQESMDNI
jgi:hypothetical protein